MATRPGEKPKLDATTRSTRTSTATSRPIVGPDDERVITDSGIEIKPLYDEDDVAPGPRGAPRRAGPLPLHPRDPRADVPRPHLDDAPVRGLLEPRGHERALPLPDRARLDRALDGLRPADPARPRLRRPALRGRGRPHRRPDRHDRGHADLLRPDLARRRLDLDDDQRARRDPAAALRTGRRGAGRPVEGAARHGPERRAEGVHLARQLHLPARADDAADHRHLRLLRRERPEVEHDLDQRVPHPREGLLGRAGGRLHPRQRDRLRRGRHRRRASTSTASASASPSSSTATTTSSRRSPSSGRCAGCGRRS